MRCFFCAGNATSNNSVNRARYMTAKQNTALIFACILNINANATQIRYNNCLFIIATPKYTFNAP